MMGVISAVADRETAAMATKQKRTIDLDALARAADRVRQTTREEWERMIEMYQNEDPEALLVEPVDVTQRRYLSTQGDTSIVAHP